MDPCDYNAFKRKQKSVTLHSYTIPERLLVLVLLGDTHSLTFLLELI